MINKTPIRRFKQAESLLLLLIVLTKLVSCCAYAATVATANKIADLPSRRSARVLARNQPPGIMAGVVLTEAQLQTLIQQAVQLALTAALPPAPVAAPYALGPGGVSYRMGLY